MAKFAQPSIEKDYYQQSRPEMLKFVPENARQVLELGCSEGHFAASVKARNGAEVWGIEFNPVAAECARASLDHVLVGDADEQIASLPDGYFDVVICNDVLEHLANPIDTLKSLRLKLKDDGVVVASLPNIRHLPALSRIVFQKDFPQDESGIFDRTHLRFFTRKSMFRFFQEAGFEVRRIKGICGYAGPLGLLLIPLSLGFFADGFFLQYACVATPVDHMSKTN